MTESLALAKAGKGTPALHRTEIEGRINAKWPYCQPRLEDQVFRMEMYLWWKSSWTEGLLIAVPWLL